MSRDEAIRWAALVPRWLGVDISMDGKDDQVLGGAKAKSGK